MSHGSRDDGSWSRALMAASGIGGVADPAAKQSSPAWHEASGADLAGTRFLELAHHRDPAVREALARRTDCPLGVLASLAHDSRSAVRAAVASNPSARAVVLDDLARDRDPGVLKAVARNAATSRDTLERLCTHRRHEVRRVAERALTETDAQALARPSTAGSLPLELRDASGAAAPQDPPGPARRNPPAFHAPKPVMPSRRPSPRPGPEGSASPAPQPGG